MSIEKIQITRPGEKSETFDAYLVGTAGSPGVVVIQEWWGVDYEIKNHATTLAAKGYRCLVPDLYRGKLALDDNEAHHLMDGLDWPGAVADIGACADWLLKNGSPKVGVTGFCMGGALTIASAVLCEGISAAVPFYGTPPLQLADPAKAKAPIQGHFGEEDRMTGFSDSETGLKLGNTLTKAGVENEIFIYRDQGHAFMNSSPEAKERKAKQGLPEHSDAAVDMAWKRLDKWFSKYLK